MVAAISMCKDEADVAEHTLRRMAAQVDVLIVADNRSTDGTRDILDELARELPLTVIDDHEVGYYQSVKMTRLAARAAAEGAEWVVPFDFDEAWYSPFGRIADVLAGQDPSLSIAGAALYDHVPTAEDSTDPDHTARICWRRVEPGPLPKVACRPASPVTIHQGNHGCDYGARTDDLLVVRHYPLRSVEQMVRKARNGAKAYAATNLPATDGAHWRGWGALTDEQLGEVFRQFYWSPAPQADPGLIFDPAP